MLLHRRQTRRRRSNGVGTVKTEPRITTEKMSIVFELKKTFRKDNTIKEYSVAIIDAPSEPNGKLLAEVLCNTLIKKFNLKIGVSR